MNDFVLLAALSLGYAVVTRRVERLRRAVDQDRVPNMLNVWQWAAITVLPLNVVWLSVVIGYIAEWPSRKAVGGGRPGKYAYSCAGYAISATAASYSLHRAGHGLRGYAVAVPVFMCLNMGLVVAAILAERKPEKLKMLTRRGRHVLEVQTILLGIGLGLATSLDGAVPLAVAPIAAPALLWAIQRRAAAAEVTQAQAYDPITRFWRRDLFMLQAADLVNRGQYIAVIVIQTALPGREHLVAAALDTSPLRQGDLRAQHDDRHYLAASLAGTQLAGEVICARIRRRLDELGMDCAVGCFTAADAELDAMIASAFEEVRIRRAERVAQFGAQ